MHVIDLSNYQHPNGAAIDFHAIKNAGIDGVIIKATEGTGYTNPYFAQDRAGAKAAGLRVGCYHFARPSQNAPHAEAAYFLGVVGQPYGDFLVLDTEDPNSSNSDLRSWAFDWLTEVENSSGEVPWVYSYGSYLVNTLRGDTRFGRYPLWEAAYQSTPPTAPAPWSAYTLWQYTDKASVPGVSTAVDESVGTIPGGDEMNQTQIDQLNQIFTQVSFLYNDLIGGTEDNQAGVAAVVHRIEADLKAASGGSLPQNVQDALVTIANHLK